MEAERAQKAPASATLIGVLGYGGAAAALAASSIALGDMSEIPVRVGVNAATVLVLLAVGWLVGAVKDDGFHRMRSVFWFLALFSWGSLMGVFAGPEGLDLEGKWQAFAVAIGVAALAWPLWAVERRSLQLIGAFFSLHAAAVALVYSDKTLPFIGPVPDFTTPALVTIGLGVAAFALGAGAAIKPRRTAMVLGSLAAVFGSLFVDVDLLSMSPGTGPLVLALVVAVAVLIVGDMLGERAPAGIGIAATLVLVSALVDDQIDEQGPAVVVLVVGLAMLAATVTLVRSRREPPVVQAEAPPVPPPPTPPPTEPTPPTPQPESGA